MPISIVSENPKPDGKNQGLPWHYAAVIVVILLVIAAFSYSGAKREVRAQLAQAAVEVPKTPPLFELRVTGQDGQLWTFQYRQEPHGPAQLEKFTYQESPAAPVQDMVITEGVRESFRKMLISPPYKLVLSNDL